MTHADFRADNRSDLALEGTDCTGELVRLPDPTPDRRDPADGHLVELYRCERCGHTISYDATIRRVRNDYADPRGLVVALAEMMRVRR